MNINLTEYSPWIIKGFNMLPHLNMWFTMSNSSQFDPYNPDYLETILFWSTVPILFLIFLLLLLIMYACCLVCSGNSPPNYKQSVKTSLCKHKSLVTILLFILSASLAFMVYGSEHFHYSFKDLTGGIKNFSMQFERIGESTSAVRQSIAIDLSQSLNKFDADMSAKARQQLQTASSSSSSNRLNDQVGKIKNELKNIRQSLNQSLNSLDTLNQLVYERNAYTNVLKEIENVEQTRWGIMIGVVTVNLLLIVLLVIGLISNSKGSLCFFAFAGVLALISIWILNALYLGIAVFISDYCLKPNEYTVQLAERNNVKSLIVQYYTQCPKSPKLVPFQQELYKSQSKLNTAQTLYNDNVAGMTKTISDDLVRNSNFTRQVDQSNRMLNNISQLITCEQTSANFRSIIRTLCTNSIFGLTVVLAMGLVFGLILPLLICIIPQLWRRMHNNLYYSRSRSSQDEGHPFIPAQTTARSNLSAARHYNDSPNFHRRMQHHSELHADPYMKYHNGMSASTAAASPYYMRSGTTRTITGV